MTVPCAMLSAVLGTISSGSKYSFSPRPSQAGQAPCGALKENRRGSISDMVKPETGQANFSEKVMRSGVGVSGADLPFATFLPPSPFGEGPGEGTAAASALVDNEDKEEPSPSPSPRGEGGSKEGEGREEEAAPAATSANSTTASPSASFSAVSNDSASRGARPSFTTMRSTTTSMSCLYFLSSAGASSMSTNAPSILTR